MGKAQHLIPCPKINSPDIQIIKKWDVSLFYSYWDIILDLLWGFRIYPSNQREAAVSYPQSATCLTQAAESSEILPFGPPRST